MKTICLGLLVVAACGGASAEGPLTVTIGTDRTALVRQLRDHQYCEGAEPPLAGDETEMFQRCAGPGAEFSQSWVKAYYDGGGRVVKIQRWEKFSDADRGLERFNALVEKRTRANGQPSVEAKAMIGAQEELPPGTRTWVAFRSGDDALVAVYHLDPKPPENANVLEEIIEAQTDGSSELTP